MRRISMSFAKEALYNAFRFVINVGFIFLFQMMFHAENTLTAVALSVGFTMLPNSELHIRPGAMCCAECIAAPRSRFPHQFLVSRFVAGTHQ